MNDKTKDKKDRENVKENIERLRRRVCAYMRESINLITIKCYLALNIYTQFNERARKSEREKDTSNHGWWKTQR